MAEMAETRRMVGNTSDPIASLSPIRIAIVVSHPIQYFAPLYRATASIHGVDLKVFFCRNWGANRYYDRDFQTELKWDIPLLEGYPSEFLDTKSNKDSLGFLSVDNPIVGRALGEFRPDVVMVHGYAYRTMWRAVKWCNQNGVPVMISSDSNGAASKPLWKRFAKSLVVGRFYRGLDGAFSNGENNRLYHRQFGMPEQRLFNGMMPIDCAQLIKSTGDPLQAREQVRRRHGIPQNAFVVVFAGKLIPLKCVPHLLEAVRRCVEDGSNVGCLLVGEGSERPLLEQFIRDHGMRTVVLTGFVNQSEIGKYYAASDAVALMSSREAKGAPVAEAGVFGCPAILCDRVGCIGPSDSARPNENALVYPWSDIEALTNCIARLCGDQPLFRTMSQAARRIAQEQDASLAALRLQKAALQLRNLGIRRAHGATT